MDQFGAVPGRGAGLASLTARCAIVAAPRLNLPLFCLFVDLSKAFDLAIRELIMGWTPSMKCALREAMATFMISLAAAEKRVLLVVDWIDTIGVYYVP